MADVIDLQLQENAGTYGGTTLIAGDASDEMTFKDSIQTTPVTLTELLDGGVDGGPRYIDRTADSYFIQNGAVVELWVNGVLAQSWT